MPPTHIPRDRFESSIPSRPAEDRSAGARDRDEAQSADECRVADGGSEGALREDRRGAGRRIAAGALEAGWSGE